MTIEKLIKKLNKVKRLYKDCGQIYVEDFYNFGGRLYIYCIDNKETLKLLDIVNIIQDDATWKLELVRKMKSIQRAIDYLEEKENEKWKLKKNL